MNQFNNFDFFIYFCAKHHSSINIKHAYDCDAANLAMICYDLSAIIVFVNLIDFFLIVLNTLNVTNLYFLAIAYH